LRSNNASGQKIPKTEAETCEFVSNIVTTNYTSDELIRGSRSEATAYAMRRLRDYCDTIALD
jgi:hypothetical protein